jgi:hypothetical protein
MASLLQPFFKFFNLIYILKTSAQVFLTQLVDELDTIWFGQIILYVKITIPGMWHCAF